MPAKIPDMKFDKDQTPWARWAQNEITALTQRLAAKDASDSNINQGSSATLALLGGQIQALADAEGTLATQQTTLATTVATLTTQQAALTAAQAALVTLASQQVTPSVNSDSSTGFTPTTSYATYSSFTFTVPVGFTRVVIIASGSIAQTSSASGGDRYYARVQIRGSVGQEIHTINTSAVETLSASHAGSFTGLTAGSTIAVSIQGHLGIGPGDSLVADAVLTGMAIFLT